MGHYSQKRGKNPQNLSAKFVKSLSVQNLNLKKFLFFSSKKSKMRPPVNKRNKESSLSIL